VDMFREVGSGVRSSPHRSGLLFGCIATAVSVATRAFGTCADGPARAFTVFRGHKTLLVSGFKDPNKVEDGRRPKSLQLESGEASLKVLGEIGEACQLEELLASGGLVDDFVFEDPGEVVGDEDGVQTG